MKVHVKLFASTADLVGEREVVLDLPDGATMADLRAVMVARYPRLQGVMPTVACAVNEEYETADTPLQEGDEIALIPPVSGGNGAGGGPFTGQNE